MNLVLVAVALLSTGCAADGSLELPFLSTATPSVTPTATATATPTATSTPTPSPTATPSPTPTPAPPRAEVTISPTLSQGGLLVVEVTANYPITSIKGEAAGRTVRFDVRGATATGFLGFRSDARTGAHTLSLQVVAARGEPVWSEHRFQVLAAPWPVEHIQVDEASESLLAPAVLNNEWVRLQTIAGRVSQRRLWDGPFIRPVPGGLTGAYGTRRSYNNGPPGSPHEGADFAAAVGEPVLAANSGVVVVSDAWDVRGEVVGIDHGLGVFSGYYHLSQRLVALGEPVTKGQVIGRVGATGLVTGPHLHWDLIAQGANTSPLEWTQRTLPQ